MCDIPENVETDLTLAAVAVGGAMVVAEKAGSTKAHKMKAKLEKKQDEWARFKKKYPTFFGVVEWLNSIVDSALGYADLITDLLSVQLYLSLGHYWWGFWTILFITLPFLATAYSIGKYVTGTYGNDKFLGCFTFCRILPFLPLLPPIIDMAMPLLLIIAMKFDEFAIFLASYSAVSTFTQAFLESLPQTLLQGWIIYRCANASSPCGLDVDSSFVVWRGWIVSLLNIAKQLLNNYLTAKQMGLSGTQYLKSLMELGQGLPLQALKKNDIDVLEFPHRQHPFSKREIELLTNLLKTNTSVKECHLPNLRINMDGAMKFARVFGYTDGTEEKPGLESAAVVPMETAKRRKEFEKIDLEEGLAKKKKYNTTIKVLNLNGNEIGTNSALALADVLLIDGNNINELYLADNSCEVHADNKDDRHSKRRIFGFICRCFRFQIKCCGGGSAAQENAHKTASSGLKEHVKAGTIGKQKARQRSSILPHSANSMTEDIAIDDESQVALIEKQEKAQRCLMQAKVSKLYKKSNARLEERRAKRKKLAMAIMENHDTIRQVHCFKHLPQEKINALVDKMRLVVVRDKKRICQSGAPAQAFYIIVKGDCKVFIDCNAHATLVNVMHTLDSFGEFALVDHEATRSATVVAEGEVHLMALSRDDYELLRRQGVLDKRTHDNLMLTYKEHKIRDAHNKNKYRTVDLLRSPVNKAVSRLKQFLVQRQLKHPDEYNAAAGTKKKKLQKSRTQRQQQNKIEQFIAQEEEKQQLQQLALEDSAEMKRKRVQSRVEERNQRLKQLQMDMMKQHGQLLRKIPFFAKLSDSSWNSLVGAFREVNFKDSETICHIDDDALAFYVLLDGKVDVFIPTVSVKALHQISSLAEVDPVSEKRPYFGEQALAGGRHKRRATCRANGPVKLMALTRDRFETVMRHHNVDVKFWRPNDLKIMRQEILKVSKEYDQKNMYEFNICNEAAIKFGKSIATGKTKLKVLDLQRNRIDETGALGLARELKGMSHCHLDILNISGYEIYVGALLHGTSNINFMPQRNGDSTTISQKGSIGVKENKPTRMGFPFCCVRSQLDDQNGNELNAPSSLTILDLKVVLMLLSSDVALSRKREIDFRLIDEEFVAKANSANETEDAITDEINEEGYAAKNNANRDKTNDFEPTRPTRENKSKLLAMWLTQIHQRDSDLSSIRISNLRLKINKLDFQGAIHVEDLVEMVEFREEPPEDQVYEGLRPECKTIGYTIVLKLHDWKDVFSVHKTILALDDELICPYSDEGYLHVQSKVDQDMEMLYTELIKRAEVHGINGQLDLFNELFGANGHTDVDELYFPLADVDCSFSSDLEKAELIAPSFGADGRAKNISHICVDHHIFKPKALVEAKEVTEFCDSNLSTAEVIILGKILTCNSHLTSLDLSSNQHVNDSCSDFLTQLKHLKKLDLTNTGIGERTVNILTSALTSPSCTITTLEMTNLSNVHVTEACAGLFVNMLKSNTTLTSLRVDWNIFPLEELCQLFETNHKALPTTWEYSKDNLRFVEEDAVRLAKALTAFKRLEYLKLDKFEIHPSKLKAQSHCDFSKQFLTDADVIIILSILADRNSRLELLDLSDNPDIGMYCGPTIYRLISVSTGLKTINLSGCDIREALVCDIGAWLATSTLETMYLQGCSRIADKAALSILKGMQINKSLRILRMDFNQISGNIMAQMIGLSHPALPPALEINIPTTESSATFLGDALVQNRYIESLQIGSFCFRPIDLATAKVVRLDSDGVNDLTVVTIAQFLKRRSHALEVIDVSNINTSDIGGLAISGLLDSGSSVKRSLREINMDNSTLSDATVQKLIDNIMAEKESRSEKTFLRVLKLRQSNITSTGALRIIEWLNSGLCHLAKEQLCLDYQNFSADIIYEMLSTNHECLPTAMSLCATSCGEAEKIARAIEHNENLVTITLGSVPLDVQMMRESPTVNFGRRHGDTTPSLLTLYDFVLVIAMVHKNTNVTTLNLKNTFEQLEDLQERAEVVKRLAALIKAKVNVMFALEFCWDLLDIPSALSFLKTNCKGLPKDLDLSKSNPTAEQAMELGVYLQKNKFIEFVKLCEVYVNMVTLGMSKIDPEYIAYSSIPKTAKSKGSRSLLKLFSPADLKLMETKIAKNENLDFFYFDAKGETAALDDYQMTQLMKGLKSKDKLTRISIQNCKVGDKCCIELKEVIKSCRRLNSVSLSKNEITEDGALELITGVFDRARVQHSAPALNIDLCMNQIKASFAPKFKKIMLANKKRAIKLILNLKNQRDKKERKKLIKKLNAFKNSDMNVLHGKIHWE